MAPLLAADLRATRLHTVAIRLAWVVSLAVLLVAEVAAGDVVPVVPWVGRLWLAAVLLLTSIWALPRWTLACASMLGWLLPYGGASWPSGWRAWAIASALALAWLVVPRRTQSTVSRGRPAGERPFERSYANIGAVTGGVALAATAVAVAVLSIIEVIWGTPESMLLGLIAFVLLLGLSAWPRAQHRHAARLRLMAEGGPAREALLTEVDGDHFVGAVDDDRARLRIVALDGVVDREDAGIIQLAHDDDGALINLDDLDDEDAAKVRRAMADLRRWTALCPSAGLRGAARVSLRQPLPKADAPSAWERTCSGQPALLPLLVSRAPRPVQRGGNFGRDGNMIHIPCPDEALKQAHSALFS